MRKSARLTFKFKAKNDYFKEILNIQYQSGGYSIFRCENPPRVIFKFKAKNDFLKKFLISNINLVDIRYSISNINLVDIRYSDVKI